MSVENLKKAVDSEGEGQVQKTTAQESSRRWALSAVMVGGMSSLLAACGKYVARFDKPTDGKVGVRGTGDGSGLPPSGGSGSSGDANQNPVDGGGGGGGGGGDVPGDPLNPNFDPRPCLDVSKVNPVVPRDVLVVEKPAMYGSSQSALLAIKFKSTELSAGDTVLVLGLRPIDETKGVLLAMRRVQSCDSFPDGVGVIFESLSFSGFKKLAVIRVRGGMSSKFAIDLTSPFRKSLMDGAAEVPVLDLLDARVPAENKKLFADGLKYYENCPTAPKNILTNTVSLGSTPANQTVAAATKNTRWNNLSSFTLQGSAGVVIEDIFGSPLAVNSSTFHQHQSINVYVKKIGTVDGKQVQAFLRYSFYIG